MLRRLHSSLDDGQFRQDLDENGRLSDVALNSAITELNLRRTIARKLGNYFHGENVYINKRARPQDASANTPDNRVPIPYGRKLVNTVVGYMYKPGFIQYSSSDENYQQLVKGTFFANGEQSKTSRIGKICSIFGIAYELHYTKNPNGDPKPRFALVPPEDFLPVYSNDIEPEIVAGIYRYWENRGDKSIEHIDVYYEDAIVSYSGQGTAHSMSDLAMQEEVEHGYGMVPVAVYRNNDEMCGDFEHILPLIDAYDVLMSDSMNEFDRFAWAYLILKNLAMNDEDIDDVKVKRVFEVMDNGGVEFLTKEIQHEFIEYMKDWIKDEIHKQSHIPDFSDKHFAGNQSGIAIRYKLADLENIAAVKEIGFREGLMRRFELLNAFWKTRGVRVPEMDDIDISMQRNVPENYTEQADIVSRLRGHVSLKTLLDKVLTFTESGEEMERLEEEADVYAAPDIEEEEIDEELDE